MVYKFLKRIIDIILAILCTPLFLPIFILLFIIVKVTSKGPIIYWSNRVGKNEKIFQMPKIRTMEIDTPQVATHLLKNPKKYLTPIGSFLRKTSLDELPQIWSVLLGHMSFVGPRPALFNQYDLIKYRRKYLINVLLPGITGWAQINGRDDLSADQKVNFDLYYLQKCSIAFDIKIIVLTFLVFFKKNDVLH
jgi:O-antigen biosynthesis protein WbqP